MSKIRTCLRFDGTAEAAAQFHVSLFPGSDIEGSFGMTAQGAPLRVDFHLAGVPYQGPNGGDRFRLGPAASIQAITEDQGQTDRLWAALIADGGRKTWAPGASTGSG